MKFCAVSAGLLLLAVASCGSDAEGTSRDAITAGWSARFDDPDERAEAMRFVRVENGLEAMPGPNACLWHPDLRASGDYRVSVDVTHLDSGAHPHGAGLAFGGEDVHGADQRYTYFLVRSDRRFLIKSRIGDRTEDVVSGTEHEAVASTDDAGVTSNELRVEVRGDEVRFSVNGAEVHREPREGLSTDGRIGLRTVHDIHVRFGEPHVEAW